MKKTDRKIKKAAVLVTAAFLTLCISVSNIDQVKGAGNEDGTDTEYVSDHADVGAENAETVIVEENEEDVSFEEEPEETNEGDVSFDSEADRTEEAVSSENEGPAVEDADEPADAFFDPSVQTAASGTPAKVKALSIENLENGGIRICWEQTDGADGYNIYRSENGGEFTLVTARKSDKTAYLDKNVVNGREYSYRIAAYKKAGGVKKEGTPSKVLKTYALNAVNVKAISNPGYKQIKVSWRKNSQADGYRITYKAGNSSKNVYITGNSTTKTVLNVYSAVKTYEVYVCSYKTLNGVKKYSAKGKSGTVTLQKNILCVYTTDSKMTIKLKNTDPSLTSLKAAVWSSERGQDDLVWTTMEKESDGVYKVKLNPSQFRHKGAFIIHIYNGSTCITGNVITWNSENIGFKNGQLIKLDPNWLYADHTSINTGAAVMYTASSNRKGIIVAINAGHGTSGCYNYYNLSHPDGSPKTTGGSTAAGSIWTVCDNYGMVFNDGTEETSVTLRMARMLTDKLLAKGYDVLMLRDEVYSQLDVISRTVIANNIADCHISLHYDGDGMSYDKGVFYCSVPDEIKSMYPVSTIWQQDDRLGDCLMSGMSSCGIGIWGGNPLQTDLMQTSYSTIPSVDVELGNQCSAHDDATLNWYADGLAAGVDLFFS